MVLESEVQRLQLRVTHACERGDAGQKTAHDELKHAHNQVETVHASVFCSDGLHFALKGLDTRAVEALIEQIAQNSAPCQIGHVLANVIFFSIIFSE